MSDNLANGIKYYAFTVSTWKQNALEEVRKRKREELLENQTSGKKNKRPENSKIKVDATKHFKVTEGGQIYLDTNKLFEDNNVDPIENRQAAYITQLSRNLRDIEGSSRKVKNHRRFKERKSTHKQGIMIVDLEQDSDVEEVFAIKSNGNSVQPSSPDMEEIMVVGSVKQVDKPNVAVITMDDDDILVISEKLI